MFDTDTFIDEMEKKAAKQRDEAYSQYVGSDRILAWLQTWRLQAGSRIDDVLHDLRCTLSDMPGDTDWLDFPYKSIEMEKDDDGSYHAFISMRFYPYTNAKNAPAMYDWLVEHCKDADECGLSYDGKRMTAVFSVTAARVRAKVFIDAPVSEEDEWMLRSLGKIRTVETPARVEQSLVCG